MKNFLRTAHRWVGLILAPFFAILLITSIILAFHPILAPKISSVPIGERAPQLVAAVEKLTAAGISLPSLDLDADGQHFWVGGGRSGQPTQYDLATAKATGHGGMSMALYNTAKGLHKSLLLKANWLIEAVTYAMLLMIVAAVALWMKPRFDRHLISWHNGLGLLLFPLWLLPAVTAIMMTLHIGAPAGLKLEKATLPVPQALALLDQHQRLPDLIRIRSIRGRAVIELARADGTGTESVQAVAGELKPVTLGRYWPKELHEGTWGGALSGTLNLLTAAVLLFFLGSGLYLWSARTLRTRAERRAAAQASTADSARTFLVAHASQTGTAHALAQRTAEHLTASGQPAHCASLAALRPADLARHRAVLLLCATTGDGELPDSARPFAAELERTPGSVQGVRYALLALGDRHYPHFCRGGERLGDALTRAGATPLQPLTRTDGDPTAVWQDWMQQLAQTFRFTLADAPADNNALQETDHLATLTAKTRLDRPEAGGREVWALDFTLQPPADFRGGDLLLITPPGDTLARPYSIGSDSRHGTTVRLTVGLQQTRDEQGQTHNGLASDWLQHRLSPGDTIPVRLRPHPAFRLPDDPAQPLILVATGTGIAPFPGFLPELRRQPRPVWLFFGNAHSHGGDYYRADWERAREDGTLTRLDLVFDDEQPGFVQGAMLRHGAELYRWLNERNAALYACGRATTLGHGVLEALKTLHRDHGDPALTPDEWLARLHRQERLHMDLFG